jgi:hypothetical protein
MGDNLFLRLTAVTLPAFLVARRFSGEARMSMTLKPTA